MILPFFLGLCTVPVRAGEADEATAAEPEKRQFLGLNWELSGTLGTPLDLSEIDMLSLTFTYGRKGILGPIPLRLRAGAGWWPRKPFALLAGIELAVFERLTAADTRKFGIYLFGDLHLRFPGTTPTISFEPSIRCMIPLTSVGGPAFGLGYEFSRGITWKLEHLGGMAFP